jgi:sulfoxide reductase catalytic subunit YedY
VNDRRRVRRSARWELPASQLTDEGTWLSRRQASRHNNFYELSSQQDAVWRLADVYPHRPWTIEVEGLVDKPRAWDVDELIRRFDQQERHYRFRCVEAWAATIPWTGFPLSALLAVSEPRPEARYVRLVSEGRADWFPGVRGQQHYPWPYHEALTLPEALNELTILATGVYGRPLPGQHGAPLRLITPWKYGYKQPKAIVRIELVAERPPTFWNTVSPWEYDFGGVVDPSVPHPRWSQATERLLDDGSTVPTQKWNGYGEQVAHLYRVGAVPGFGER